MEDKGSPERLAALLSHPEVSKGFFFAHKDSFPFKANYPITCRDGVKLFCHYDKHNAASGARTVIFFHGNGELVSGYVERPKIEGLPDIRTILIEELGLNVLWAEYRGYGACTAAPDLMLMLNDVEDILRAIELPPEQLIVFGRSLGGLYTIHAAHVQPDLAGIVLESALSDLPFYLYKKVNAEAIGTTQEELKKAADGCVNLHGKLAAYTGRALIIHCKDDVIVSLEQEKECLELLANANVHELLFDVGGHNYIWPMNWTQYAKGLEEFVVACGHTIPPRQEKAKYEDLTTRNGRSAEQEGETSTGKGGSWCVVA